MIKRYFEDIVIGEVLELGSHTFGADEIKDFARQFDPQEFHLSEEAAEKSIFGGLAASGWHTASVCMKMMIGYHLREAQEGNGLAMGFSPGFRDLRWHKPVRVNDTLRFTSYVKEKVELKTRPEWGLSRSQVEGTNQNGELAYSFTGQVFVRRRPT